MIKQVGEVNIQPNHRATCHCGMVEFELNLPEGLVDPKRCNCSICRRKGAVMAYVQTRSNPTVYGFNVGCLEGVNPCDLDGVPVSDGINHESDL